MHHLADCNDKFKHQKTEIQVQDLIEKIKPFILERRFKDGTYPFNKRLINASMIASSLKRMSYDDKNYYDYIIS